MYDITPNFWGKLCRSVLYVPATGILIAGAVVTGAPAGGAANSVTHEFTVFNATDQDITKMGVARTGYSGSYGFYEEDLPPNAHRSWAEDTDTDQTIVNFCMDHETWSTAAWVNTSGNKWDDVYIFRDGKSGTPFITRRGAYDDRQLFRAGEWC